MARKSVVIRLAGESGEGVISSGDILTQAAARGGYWTQTFRTYPAEIKGGPCMYQVRMGEMYESIKLINYNRAFQASSRVISVANEMLDLLIKL